MKTIEDILAPFAQWVTENPETFGAIYLTVVALLLLALFVTLNWRKRK